MGCCLAKNISYNFNIINSNIICTSYTDGYIRNDIKILEGIKNEKVIEELISLINIIVKNILILNCRKQKFLINELKLIFRKLFETFLSKNEISKKLEVIELFVKNGNNDSLLSLFDLFKLIYSKKEEIKEEKLRIFIYNIKFVLETNEILKEDNINKFGNELNKIFFEDDDTNKYLNLENEDILTSDENIEEKSKEEFINEEKVLIKHINSEKNKEEKQKEKPIDGEKDISEHLNIEKEDNLIFDKNIEDKSKEKFLEELEKMSSSSLQSFCTYSKSSQNQIIKLEEKIRELEEEKKKRKNIKKRFLKLKIFYKNEQKYSLDIDVNENDKFSVIIDELYEKYPEIEEKGVKKFLLNGEKIKRNELIKNLKFNDCSKLEIEY